MTRAQRVALAITGVGVGIIAGVLAFTADPIARLAAVIALLTTVAAMITPLVEWLIERRPACPLLDPEPSAEETDRA